MANLNLMSFLRGGLGTGGFAEVNLTGGCGWRPASRTADLFGLGVGWCAPDDAQIPVPLPFSLPDRATAEVFYRLAVTPNLAVTPAYQLIVSPSLNPGVDSLSVLSVRARLVFLRVREGRSGAPNRKPSSSAGRAGPRRCPQPGATAPSPPPEGRDDGGPCSMKMGTMSAPWHYDTVNLDVSTGTPRRHLGRVSPSGLTQPPMSSKPLL
jgi:hypothetical protein